MLYADEFTECDEVAGNMRPPAFACLDDAFHWVNGQMPDESMTIRDNIAVSLWDAQRRTQV